MNNASNNNSNVKMNHLSTTNDTPFADLSSRNSRSNHKRQLSNQSSTSALNHYVISLNSLMCYYRVIFISYLTRPTTPYTTLRTTWWKRRLRSRCFHWRVRWSDFSCLIFQCAHFTTSTLTLRLSASRSAHSGRSSISRRSMNSNTLMRRYRRSGHMLCK